MLFIDDIWMLPLLVPALLLAVTFHEYAHGRMALAMGDPTASMQGRLTLNPLAHLDPLGSLMILLVGFGWAKPVPINPARFRNYREGLLKVSLAGPFANFLLAFISLLLLELVGATGYFLNLFVLIAQINIALGVFNLLPVPPLDGSKVLVSLMPSTWSGFYRQLEAYGPFLFIAIIIFGGRFIFPLIVFIFERIYSIVLLFTGF